MRMASPPPDHVIPATEPASKPCGAKLILQEIIRKHFEGFTACPLTSAHRFNTLMVLGKYARVWHRPYLNRANNLASVLGNLSDHILYAQDSLVINKSSPTRLFIRFHDEWTDLKFVEDIPVIDHYDYKTSKVYHAAVDLGDVVVKSINIDHLRDLLHTARFNVDQLVPGQVYHLIYSVVISSRLKFLGDLQTAYMTEIPDDVFVTQYTQFNSLRDVVCRGIGAVQTNCPIAFKTCDFVLDSQGRMTLLENWELSQSAENLVSSDLISSLDATRIIHTDSVIGSSFITRCLHGLYPVLKTSLRDKSAIPRAMRLLKMISGVSGKVTFPRPKFVCRTYEITMLTNCGYSVRSCNDLNNVAVQPVDPDCAETSRLFARVLCWASWLPLDIFNNLLKELSYEIPQPAKEKSKQKKKVRVSTSLQMSEV
ncbi:uncharacterized protein LOC134822534 [Bolinopsis microptera]|uniref:uncharacterized protein LOC134822534 n=1 Tax=Bolinopsis microptera TaxID=2820187 RepID=UPI003078CAAF